MSVRINKEIYTKNSKFKELGWLREYMTFLQPKYLAKSQSSINWFRKYQNKVQADVIGDFKSKTRPIDTDRKVRGIHFLKYSNDWIFCQFIN